MTEPPEHPQDPQSDDDRTRRTRPEGLDLPPQGGYQPPPAYSPPPPGGYQPPGQDQPLPYGRPPQGGYQPPPGYDPGAQGGYGPPPQGGYGQPSPGGYGPPDLPYGYGPQGPPGGPVPPVGVRIDLGARARRRPEVRTGVSVAGIGALLVIVGVLIWAGGYALSGLDVAFDNGGPQVSGDGRRFLGAGLFLVLAVGGYVLLVLRRRGPLASAGAVAAAAGVPLAVLFVTLSFADLFRGQLPVNLDAVYLVSIVVWLATYLFVPGAKGRALFLGAALVSISSYISVKVAGDGVLRTASAAVNGSVDAPSTGGVAAVGIVLGLVYYAAAALLDHRGLAGPAVAFVVAGFVTTVGGISAGASDLGQLGTGVALTLIGAAVTLYGGWAGRRATTWVWALLFGAGIVVVVTDIVSFDSYTAVGVTVAVLGAVVVVVAQLVSTLRGERPDIDESEPAPAAG